MKSEINAKAKKLRKNNTEAERLLWEKLRGRQLINCKFRRQHPFPPYIVDFYCAQKNLIIELDGGQHQEQRDYDDVRTQYLNSLGKRVLRFWNGEVISDTDRVLAGIVRCLNESPSP
jgi:very-short-patch-repair endonuclease